MKKPDVMKEMTGPNIMKNIEQYMKQNPGAQAKVQNLQNQMKEMEYANMTPREKLRARLKAKQSNRESKHSLNIKQNKAEAKKTKDEEEAKKAKDEEAKKTKDEEKTTIKIEEENQNRS